MVQVGNPDTSIELEDQDSTAGEQTSETPEESSHADTEGLNEFDEETLREIDETAAELLAGKPADDAAAPRAGEEESDDSPVTLTRKEIQERERRARQAGYDRGSRDSHEVVNRRQQEAEMVTALRDSTREQISRLAQEHLSKSGELPSDFAEEAIAAYEGAFYERAETQVGSRLAMAAIQALNAYPFVGALSGADFQRIANSATDEGSYHAIYDLLLERGKEGWKKDEAKRIERQANEMLKPMLRAGMKRLMLKLRGDIGPSESLQGTAPRPGLSMKEYLNMSSDQRRALNPKDIDAMMARET